MMMPAFLYDLSHGGGGVCRPLSENTSDRHEVIICRDNAVPCALPD